LQRLPFHRIQRAHELSEVDLEEDPAAAGLGAGNQPALGACANFLRMHMQEGSGLIDAQGSQGEGT
jgi:hypothetical protein